MSLGLARDSYLCLAELAKQTNEKNIEPNHIQQDSQHSEVSGQVKAVVRVDDVPNTEDELSTVKIDVFTGFNTKLNSPKDVSKVVEETKENKPSTAVTFNYSYDFGSDYYPTYDNYSAYPYVGESTKKSSHWCCLFPSWTARGESREMKTSDISERIVGSLATKVAGEKKEDDKMNRNLLTNSDIASSYRDEDDGSVGSGVFGEKLSEKDRQAVLARLRLAQPDSAALNFDQSGSNDHTKHTEKKKSKIGLLQNIPPVSTSSMSSPHEKINPPLPIKNSGGILKRKSKVVAPSSSSQSSSFKKTETKQRRSLFPTYESIVEKPKRSLNVNFADMARVVSIRSAKDMTKNEKSDVWWQRNDYDAFRKTARLISKAMLQGGSEIWLASNRSWQLVGSDRVKTLQDAYALSLRRDPCDSIERTSDKWWHVFGHSRRGLEHIASMQEGKERQANCQHAVKAVVEEQKRQFVKNKRVDAEKLRMVSIKNTCWARDLALAAGASDADAVKQNFVDGRKSREFYLLKMKNNGSTVIATDNIPSFMRPAYNLQNTLNQKIQLDNHRSSQISNKLTDLTDKKQKASPKGVSGESSAVTVSPTARKIGMEPIHDPGAGSEEISRMAAGFSNGGMKVNMAAVLIGMGAVSKQAPTVSA